MAGESIFSFWREGTSDNIGMGIYWNDRDVADGMYKAGFASGAEWDQHKIDSTDVLMFSIREALLDMDMANYIKNSHNDAVWCEMYNTNTKYPDDLKVKNIYDFPPHCNAHLYWRKPSNYAGDTNSHLYADKDAKLLHSNKVNRNPSSNTPSGATTYGLDSAWISKKRDGGTVVMQERITAEGHLEMRKGTSGAIWQIRKVSTTSHNIYENGMLIANVRRAGWHVKYISSSNPRRLVIERRNYRNGKMITETLLADAAGKLISRTEVSSSFDGMPPPMPGSPLGPIPAPGSPSGAEPVPPIGDPTMAQYYVSPSGSDSNPGTIDKPWKTPAKAAATAKAGDTVLFRAGSYSGQLVPANSGTAGNPIVFKSNDGEVATIDLGQKTKTTIPGLGAIAIRNKHYIVIDGLRVLNSGHFGVNVDQGSSNIVVKNCHIEFTFASGVMADGSSNVVIENNTLHNICHNIGGAAPNEGISIRGSKLCKVIDNTLVTCGKEGIDVKTGSSNVEVAGNYLENVQRTAFYCDAYDKGVSDIWFHHNMAVKCQHGYVLRSEKGADVSNIRFTHNVARSCGYYGLWLASSPDGAAATFKDVAFMYNTCVGNGTTGNYAAMRVNAVKISGLVIERNLFWQNSGGDKIDISSGLPTGEPKLSNNFLGSADPRFTDLADDNYTLKEGSPALGTGAFPELGTTTPPPDPKPPPPEPEPEPEPLPAPHSERFGLDGLAITFEQEPDGDWVMVIRKGGA
jgi:hypothetical protein